MRLKLLAFIVVSVLAAPEALAHGKKKHGPAALNPGRDVSQAELDVAPAAADAVASVERFTASLGAGDLDKAAAELDPKVLILESGGVERSRDEYLAGHAGHDAAFLKSAHVMLKRRTAHATGDLAWIATESDIHAKKGDELLSIASTETMVLRRSAGRWKIVHIHWSSRRAT
jgi:ketosteroid isomerase-like protein